jgi:hypothetical protein
VLPSGSGPRLQRLGLVASLARPGSNLTGINFLNRELAAKQLELLREVVPAIRRVAVLVNPGQSGDIEVDIAVGGTGRPRFGTASRGAQRQH